MNPKEIAIRRIIYRRIVGYEFVTSSGIRVPVNIQELNRRIIEDYPNMPEIDGIIGDLSRVGLVGNEAASRSNVPGTVDLSELPDPEESIAAIHRRIRGTDYHASELYGLPVPIDRLDWERRHAEVLRRHGLEITVAE